MLLRYVLLHRMPMSEEEWAAYRLWKAAQLLALPCDICSPEVAPSRTCEGCQAEDCPKKRHKASYSP